MKNSNWLKFFLMLFLVSGFLLSCDNETEKEDSMEEEQMEESDVNGMDKDNNSTSTTTQKMEEDHSQNPRNPDWYSYNYLLHGKEQQGHDYAADKNSGMKDGKVVYDITDTDRPPIFSPDCLDSKDPEKCSNKEVIQFVRRNIRFPEEASKEGQDGTELVIFTIDENGRVGSNLEVISKGSPCTGCTAAAKAVVAEMGTWVPAMRDGKPVSVKVTLPIRFETI